MIGQTTFYVLLALAWLSEFAFGSVIIYWFVTQGLSDNDHALTGTDDIPLESAQSVRVSLGAWAGFFVVLGVLIIAAS